MAFRAQALSGTSNSSPLQLATAQPGSWEQSPKADSVEVATRDPRDPRAWSSIEKIRPYESIWVFVSGLQPHFLTFTNHFRFFPGLFPPKKISKNPPSRSEPPSDRRISQHSPAAQSTETEASHRNPARCWRRRGSADTRWRSTYHSLELPFKSLNSAWKMLS